jgi:hypothetical protein
MEELVAFKELLSIYTAELKDAMKVLISKLLECKCLFRLFVTQQTWTASVQACWVKVIDSCVSKLIHLAGEGRLPLLIVQAHILVGGSCWCLSRSSSGR